MQVDEQNIERLIDEADRAVRKLQQKSLRGTSLSGEESSALAACRAVLGQFAPEHGGFRELRYLLIEEGYDYDVPIGGHREMSMIVTAEQYVKLVLPKIRYFRENDTAEATVELFDKGTDGFPLISVHIVDTRED